MFGECHAHIIMDGVNYRHAIDMHKNGPDDKIIREHLKAYQERGIVFVRDGGDALGVSARAKELAPEYGIDYRTPIFAIHKEGHYGSIVGKGFATMVEFHKRVLEAKQAGADFIKIMTTGILDFNEHGAITGTPLDGSEVKEMVHIAHEEGMAVMSHTNGDYGVQAAVAAGVDSLEHGNYMNEESLAMLAESDTVWVPTLVTVRNLLGDGRYDDETLKPIIESAEENIRKALYASKNFSEKYTATMMQAGEFSPTLHSKMTYNEAFRANQFVGAGIRPVYRLNQMFHLRGEFYGFMPIYPIEKNSLNKAYYGKAFSKFEYLGEISVVCQLPFGDISAYVNHYSSPRKEWNVGLSIGLQLFNYRFIE